jgi:hypothetical protein
MLHREQDFIAELKFLNILNYSIDKYFKFTSRSNKKIMVIHEYIKLELSKILPDDYDVRIEMNIKCKNSSDNKRCDVVILKNNIPRVIIPTKFICQNYKQNKNNLIENLVGETYLLKCKNKDLKAVTVIQYNTIQY